MAIDCTSFGFLERQKVGGGWLLAGRGGENVPCRKSHNKPIVGKYHQVLRAESAGHPDVLCGIWQFEQPPHEAVLESLEIRLGAGFEIRRQRLFDPLTGHDLLAVPRAI